jgi:serine/threonine protein kinase
MIGTTVSHYRILERLGGGGMGIVYKAQDLKLDRPVALKFLPPELTRDPDARARFMHEARAASSLQHPNICVVHDIDETAGEPAAAGDPTSGQVFICMEYVEGETLKQRIGRGPLKVEEASDIAAQIARGLARAHEHGIVHRDIKPANIMITADGTAKIVDFGVAKLGGADTADSGRQHDRNSRLHGARTGAGRGDGQAVRRVVPRRGPV